MNWNLLATGILNWLLMNEREKARATQGGPGERALAVTCRRQMVVVGSRADFCKNFCSTGRAVPVADAHLFRHRGHHPAAAFADLLAGATLNCHHTLPRFLGTSYFKSRYSTEHRACQWLQCLDVLDLTHCKSIQYADVGREPNGVRSGNLAADPAFSALQKLSVRHKMVNNT